MGTQAYCYHRSSFRFCGNRLLRLCAHCDSASRTSLREWLLCSLPPSVRRCCTPITSGHAKLTHFSPFSTTLTSLIELASPEALPYIFTINSVAWRFGILIAPTIGGFLAEPATYFPAIFAGSIWEQYPYALSGAVVSLSHFWQ